MVRANMAAVMRWHAQDEVNQEESEQNEVDGTKKGADSTGKMMHCERAVGGGRARVTTDEELVLPVDWTEIRYIACQAPAGPALHRKRKMLNLLYTFCTWPNHVPSVLRYWPVTHVTHSHFVDPFDPWPTDPLTHCLLCSVHSGLVMVRWTGRRRIG